AFVALLASCGSGSDEPVLLTSKQDLCAGAAPEYQTNGEVTGTTAACPFVQHTENITQFGSARTSALFDGSGANIATITNECEGWTVGKDSDGVTVIVHGTTGKVISHGTLHPGQDMSRVHTPLALPISLR